jgi:hypothetical protein
MEYGVSKINSDTDDLLEPGEVFMFRIALDADNGYQASTNTDIKIEIVSSAAVVPIEVTSPSGIDEGSNLLS